MGGSPRWVLPVPTRSRRQELPCFAAVCATVFTLLEATFMPDALPPFSPTLLTAAEAAELIGSYAAVSPGAAGKDIGRIDQHMRRLIGMAPICFLATADATGKADVSPRGD